MTVLLEDLCLSVDPQTYTRCTRLYEHEGWCLSAVAVWAARTPEPGCEDSLESERAQNQALEQRVDEYRRAFERQNAKIKYLTELLEQMGIRP